MPLQGRFSWGTWAEPLHFLSSWAEPFPASSQARRVPSVLLKTLKAVWQRPAGGAVISLAVPTYREVPSIACFSKTLTLDLKAICEGHLRGVAESPT